MATTTNYGWTTPDDTALVKDGASAIRTLGSSVDTTTKALNPSTTLGDIEYRSSTSNTNTRLGIGSVGQVLTVAGGVPSWATTASGGGMTQLASGSLTGSSVTISSIDQSYYNLQLLIENFYPSSAGASVLLRFNSTTSSVYTQFKGRSSTATPAVGTDTAWYFDDNITGSSNAVAGGQATVNIYNYNESGTNTLINASANYTPNGTSTNVVLAITGLFNVVDNIDSITILCSSGNFAAGSYNLYGVK